MLSEGHAIEQHWITLILHLTIIQIFAIKSGDLYSPKGVTHDYTVKAAMNKEWDKKKRLFVSLFVYPGWFTGDTCIVKLIEN